MHFLSGVDTNTDTTEIARGGGAEQRLYQRTVIFQVLGDSLRVVETGLIDIPQEPSRFQRPIDLDIPFDIPGFCFRIVGGEHGLVAADDRADLIAQDPSVADLGRLGY